MLACELMHNSFSEVEVEKMKEQGWSTIHSACWHGLEGVLQLLLRNGADVNQRTTKRGHTPLHCAISGKAEG